MTTFQEPQPQSRRAVRQSERGDAAEPPAGFTEFPPQAPPAPPQSYAAPAQPTAAPPVFDPTSAREMWDTTARRAAQLPPSGPSSDPAPAPGRRAAAPSPAAEPLNYATQARPVTPITDAPTMRARANAPTRPSVEPQPPTQAIPQAEQPSYRVRDFSPDARRAEPTATPTWAPPQPAYVPADLQYRTEVRAPEAAPVAPTPTIAPQLEQTLTRREMRALQLAEEAAAMQSGAPAQAQSGAAAEAPMAWPFGDQAPQPTPTQELAAAINEYDALVSQPIAPQPVASPQQLPPQQPQQYSAPPPQEFAAPPAPPVQSQLQPQGYATPTPEAPTVAPESEQPQWSPPTGHWSVQAGPDDETQPYENTINRTVGSGTATTSALVLPVAPMGSDIRGALTGTGEIMLTGSIDLPLAFSSTGATARIEHDSMDALFDMHDAEVVATDSAPVRAIMAVSTHNSGQGVTHTQKPKGTRALTALLIVASSMAVLVAGLLIVAFALNIF